MYVCMYVLLLICMYVCMYVCIVIHMYVCLQVWAKWHTGHGMLRLLDAAHNS